MLYPMTPMASWSMLILIAAIIGFIIFMFFSVPVPPALEEAEAEIINLDDYRFSPLEQPVPELRLIVGANAMAYHHDEQPYDWARDGL